MKKKSDPNDILNLTIKQAVIGCSITEFPFINKETNSVQGILSVSAAVKKAFSQHQFTMREAMRQVESDLSKVIRFIKCPQKGDLIKVFWGDNEFAFGQVSKVEMEESYELDDEEFELEEKRELEKKDKVMKQFVTLIPCAEFKSPDFYFRSSRCHWTKSPQRMIKNISPNFRHR